MVRFEFLSSVYGNFRQMTNENTLIILSLSVNNNVNTRIKFLFTILLYYKTPKSRTKGFQRNVLLKTAFAKEI